VVASALESCPKCGTPRAQAASASACPRCGLASDRMAAYADKRDAEVPEAVAAAWERAVSEWSDLARHDALFALIAQHGAYAWAAAKYREHKRAEAENDAIGDRQVERLRRAAEATLLATGTARADTSPKPYRALLAVLVAMIIAIIAGLAIVNALRKPAQSGGAQPAAQQPRPVIPGTR
jgi:uncharacterized Zn finger protein (UPF0148 family)